MSSSLLSPKLAAFAVLSLTPNIQARNSTEGSSQLENGPLSPFSDIQPALDAYLAGGSGLADDVIILVEVGTYGTCSTHG